MLSSPMLHADSTDRLPCVDTVVTVTCDRCGRPGWRLEISQLGEVRIDGAYIGGGDTEPYWAAALGGPRAHRYRADRSKYGARAGAFILPADGPAGIAGRVKLVCIGRKHPRYQRIVTWVSAERAYRAAAAAGRASIRLSEI
jgi:hypothetical protein